MKILSMDEFENYKKIKLDKKGLSKNPSVIGNPFDHIFL